MRLSNYHKSVLLEETTECFNFLKENDTFIDCTAGRGGHIDSILAKHNNIRVIAIDKDLDAINYLRQKYKNNKNVLIIHDDFVNIDRIVSSLKIENVKGILLDLGTSSPQLDNADRGFSYHLDAYLDMRMNQQQVLTAYDVINNYPLDKLIKIFKYYGDCRDANNVANAIINARSKKAISSTVELAELIKLNTKFNKNKHPAKTYFQAIRIEVNNEIEHLKLAIDKILNFLNKDVCLAIITFHSLEDRIVKEKFNNYKQKHNLPSYLPINEKTTILLRTIKPSIDEINSNKRSRSAKLRILRKENNEQH